MSRVRIPLAAPSTFQTSFLENREVFAHTGPGSVMTIRKLIVLTAIVVLAGPLAISATAQTSRRWVENEVLIKFAGSADSAAARAANRTAGVAKLETLGDARWE